MSPASPPAPSRDNSRYSRTSEGVPKVLICYPTPNFWILPKTRILRQNSRHTPEQSLLPPHHWDRRDTVEGGPLHHPRAIRQIHERPVRQIDHAHDLRLLEDERRPLAKHLGLFRKLREINGDRPYLSARDGKAGTIFRHAERPFHPTGTRVGEMARHPRHLRVVEGADTDLIVRAEHADRRRDTADVLRVETADSAAEQRDHKHPDPPVPSHRLTSPTPAERSLASSPCSTRHRAGSSQALRAQETFAFAQSASRALRASSLP